ncbi:MAG: hypothetical protein WB439_16705 [Acidobacteriaceae bacterium]
MNSRIVLRFITLACSLVSTLACATTTPTFAAKVVAGSSSILVQGKGPDTITVYQFDVGYNVGTTCDPAAASSNAVVSRRIVLTAITSGTAAAPTTTSASFPLTSTSPTTIPLTQALVAGTTLCLSETAGSDTSWSTPLVVTDPNDYGRFRSYFLVGIQASNQQSSTSSSTAGQYLEAGFNSSFVRALDRYDSRLRADEIPTSAFSVAEAKARTDAATDAAAEAAAKSAAPADRATATLRTQKDAATDAAAIAAAPRSSTKKIRPGLATNVDIRLSPIPVAATTTTTPVGTGTNTPATVTPNVLSSQQAVRAVGSVYAPFKATSWNTHVDSFTIAPLARGGFGTLLNPSTANTSTSSSSSTTNVSSTSYSSAYYFWSMGSRIAWDRYSASTDEAPQTITQFLITFGEFSELPSYVCKQTSSNPYANINETTSCNLGKYAPSPTMNPTNFYFPSKTLIPRFDIESFAKLPGYPFVIGVDANLQQYTLYHKSNLDILNKPGNDIRIFIGISIDPTTFFSKTGTPSL